MKLVTGEQYGWLERTSIEIYKKMAEIADDAGFILADLKLEFGILNGKITLGDSIGPDEYRLWPKDFYGIGKLKNHLTSKFYATGFQKMATKNNLMNSETKERNQYRHPFRREYRKNDNAIHHGI